MIAPELDDAEPLDPRDGDGARVCVRAFVEGMPAELYLTLEASARSSGMLVVGGVTMGYVYAGDC